MDPSDPIQWDMALPTTGQPMCWDTTPGASWDGTVGDILNAANQPSNTFMAQQNLASLRVTPQWMTEFLGHVSAAYAMLKEKGVSLQPSERSEYPTIGLGNLGMAEAGAGLVRDNPGWFPAEYNRQELADDWADRTLLLTGVSPVSQLAELYNDTVHAVNSDILMAVNDANPYITQGAKLSGANDERVAVYRAYFKKGKARKTTPPTQ